ncbi:hypothetical protein [Arthrobacter sp. ISL-95]|uniref:hypothetical protein n=1 Tax=Arthrobacter sp. ISL-95 TaxID=2819116 RepID=UPI001BECEF20|nr:hypothetical protein [Arthrobacter sp. ISL-95]MBT2585350.1 hypothetical protein [Arthrobacter sp. ISL-95]
MKRRQSVVLACALAGTLGLSGAIALPVLAETPAPGTEPKFGVEDYNHPEAARLEAERGLKLKNGDGNIVYVECPIDSQKDLIRIESHLTYGGDLGEERNGWICFKSAAGPGWLSVEIPGSFGIKAGDQSTYVKAVQNTTTTEVTLAPETNRAISAANEHWTTVEIRTF